MIELRMLGRLSLTAADGREMRTLLGQPRRFALLAYLAAATPPGFHRRDSLLALFWPELDQEHARTALRQALRVLRAALGPEAVVSRGDEEVGLDFDRVWCDVAAFDRAVDGGASREALDLYRGPLLEGFFISDGPEFERWLERERARLREAAARAAQRLIEQCESRGNLTTATHWARRAVELAPNDEALVRRLISVLDHHGDRASALQAYQAFAQRLAAEYEAEPAAETQALVAAVRARERAAPAVPLPTVDLLARLQAGLTARYRVERELAKGRTATVFVAHDMKHDRQVALKVLHPELAAAVGPERFLREIQLAARLDHPHIVALHDSGEADGLLYFVMPYVLGESLRDRLDREPQLPIAEALRIAGDVCDALGYAHGLDVVHRDIKPENILLADGRALVTDFGIARAISAAGSDRLTETGIALGTPAYMSPEQGTEEGELDGRSDLYALGCVLYEMLAGTPPFTGPTAQAILARHAVDPVAPIRTVRDTVSAGVERAVLKALAKVPADRHASAAEFAHALAEPQPEVRVPGSRKAWLVIGAGLSAVAALALLLGFNLGGWRGRISANGNATWLRSIAVLPLDNLSRDTTQDGFADGMPAALRTDVGRSRDRRGGAGPPHTTDQQSRGLRLLLAGEDPRAARDAGGRLDRDRAAATGGGARSLVCRRPRVAGARVHAEGRAIRSSRLSGPGGSLPGHRESPPAEPRSRGGPLRQGQSDLGRDQTVRPRAGDPGRPARRGAQPQPGCRAPSSGAGLHAHRAARQGPRGAAEDARDRSRRLDGAGAYR